MPPPAISPTNTHGFEHLSDEDLHASVRTWVGRSNVALAALLAHLGEVESRGIYRNKACASLHIYCVYVLRLSEDEAYRRAKAARFVKKFPALVDAVQSGELHLTGLLLLGPHLTDANLRDVLARAKHRTKREIEKLVRQLDPLPDVPARVEPLGPRPAGQCRNTWENYVASFCPVRDLRPGERPRDWVPDDAVNADDAASPNDAAITDDVAGPDEGASTDDAALTSGVPELQEPQRYKVQFTASEEYVALLEEARDLLSHAEPGRSIEAIHLRAMRTLVDQLRKKRRGDVRKPRQRGNLESSTSEAGSTGSQSGPGISRQRDATRSTGRTRRRHVPARVRREVWTRDESRCTFVDDTGQRCRETCYLELHHIVPFARDGRETVENLTLRCRCHNGLAAEEDFGERAKVWRKGGDRDGGDRESG